MKLCGCGCGQEVNSSKLTNKARGLKKGEPNIFILGHNAKFLNKGKPLSKKHKKNLSKSLKGRKKPKLSEIRIKLFKEKKIIHPLKGKHHSKKTKEKMRQAQLRNPTRYWLGKRRYEKTKQKLRNYTREKASNWQGGKSFEQYPWEFNKKLKVSIRQRDNQTCQECGFTEQQLGYPLSVHHIDFDKKNNNSLNLISLCKSCHAQTNFNREEWIEYFQKKVNEVLK